MAPELETLTYAIGDVHGCFQKLVRLLNLCREHCGARPMRLVFIGDYIDRGSDSREVVDLLIEMQRRMPENVICLRGNHEAMALMAAEEGGNTEDWWLANGGLTTLASYRVAEAAELPSPHLQWFRALALCHDDGRRYFVHAGVKPGVPLGEQSEHDRVWIREPFLSCGDPYDRFIVHGHTPLVTASPDLRHNRVNLDTGAVFGGPLTAAAFDDARTGPIAFLTDAGRVTAL